MPFEDVVLGEVSFERSEETTVETVVEKCLEDGRRERGGVVGTSEGPGFDWAVVVLLARNRDWEWLEK